MTGGEIYNIYNGCSTLQAESVSTIAGEEIAVTITGGNVNAIHTDFGYVAQFGGAANGSNKKSKTLSLDSVFSFKSIS